MADINSETSSKPRGSGSKSASFATSVDPADTDNPAATPLEVTELLFFAYRDFTGEADAILSAYDFGRAHHRVLHFVNRRPGLRVADLLDILQITKQSLARVLKQLLDRGFIVQETGAKDRRERRLYATTQGCELAEALARLQSARIETALAAVGDDAEHIVRAFLQAMIDHEHHDPSKATQTVNSEKDILAAKTTGPETRQDKPQRHYNR